MLHPSPRELLSPALLADRCRSSLASSLNLPLSPHSLSDLQLAAEARRLGLPPSLALVGMETREAGGTVRLAAATAWLRRFHRMQPDEE